MRALLLLLTLLLASPVFAADDPPRYKLVPELGGWWSSTIPDPTSLGTVTGTNVTFTDLVSCASIQTDSNGNFACGTAGSGDLTDVNEGLAIDVTNPTGPAPSVAFDPTELTGSRTWGDASTDTIVWTWDRTTGTDPTLTFGANTVTGPVVAVSTAIELNGDRIADLTGTGLIQSGSTLAASCVAITGSADLCDGSDADSGGATAWSAIGDAAGTGSIDFAGFDQDIVSAEDGGDVLTIGTSDADQGSDTTLLRLYTNDTSDANTRFVIGTIDEDGTPANDWIVAAGGTAGGLIQDWGSTGVRVTTDGDGAVEFLGTSTGSDECLSLNLDDTSNQAVLANCASTSGLTSLTLSDIGLSVGANAITGTTGIIDYTNFDVNASGSVTLADGAALDLDAINNSSATEGLLLSQGTNVSAGTAEGQVGWDSDDDRLFVGDGSGAVEIGKYFLGNNQSNSQTATFWMGFFASESTTETNNDVLEIPSDVTVTVSSIHCEVNAAPDTGAGTQSWTCALNVNGTASSDITCVISESAVECDDTGNTVLAAGDTVNVEFLAANSPTTTGFHSFTIAVHPN